MQIEECFRDLKAPRHGWSVDYVRSKNSRRIEVLVVLATLALLSATELSAAMRLLEKALYDASYVD